MNRMRWLKFGLALCLFAGLMIVRTVRAGEMETLLDKLVEKGILTEGEAGQVLAETKEEMKKEVARSLDETMPILSRTKFSGDFRLRYQPETTKSPAEVDRNRARMRLRYGFETPINDRMKIGFRMATGNNAEKASTNQTFDSAFAKRGIWVDKAWVEYKPVPSLTFSGGKIANPFFTTDLVWDGDMCPEGIYASYRPVIQNSLLQPYFDAGYFIITPGRDPRNATDTNVGLTTFAAGFTAKPFAMPLKLGLVSYTYNDLEGLIPGQTSADYNPAGNTTVGGRWLSNYSMMEYGLELTPVSFDLAGHDMPVKLYGDYIVNSDAKTNPVTGKKENAGWLYGIKVGDVKDRWDIGFDFNVRELAGDAVPAFMSDSDFHSGGTNYQGTKFGLTVGLGKNASFGITFFDSKTLRESIGPNVRDFTMTQFDFVTKF